ncbi:MAG: rhodanese-like domain-containing protein [Chloroflexi bacterium]|nr:rhodanese-like domain-containing protein [Chloroflexota bacterium]
MKKYKPLVAFSILLLAALACNSALPQTTSTAIPTQPTPQTEADVPRINVENAKAAFDSGQAIIVDVRSVEYYAANHAGGAISIPLANIENNLGSLSLEKNQWIITYCT